MADTVRFMMYRPNLLRESERAAIYFPSHMDEVERMFLLMAILQTEMHRQAYFLDRIHPVLSKRGSMTVPAHVFSSLGGGEIWVGIPNAADGNGREGVLTGGGGDIILTFTSHTLHRAWFYISCYDGGKVNWNRACRTKLRNSVRNYKSEEKRGTAQVPRLSNILASASASSAEGLTQLCHDHSGYAWLPFTSFSLPAIHRKNHSRALLKLAACYEADSLDRRHRHNPDPGTRGRSRVAHPLVTSQICTTYLQVTVHPELVDYLPPDSVTLLQLDHAEEKGATVGLLPW
ncbi:hypothetical protein B0H14DRAFT_2558770 [Mycena olivaceomarginata]|nr:hypothetical protein B0H14DRAFT_2558770 [Mycena olivaceomarginata]